MTVHISTQVAKAKSFITRTGGHSGSTPDPGCFWPRPSHSRTPGTWSVPYRYFGSLMNNPVGLKSHKIEIIAIIIVTPKGATKLDLLVNKGVKMVRLPK